ncbi:MAG: metallophosphoesterase [Candidatus Hermodarchaeota archaeon]
MMFNEDALDRRYLLRKYNDSKVMIVSDLHLGFEAEWSYRGLDTREPQWSFTIINNLKNDIKNTKPNYLIILGDLEHSFGHYRRSKEEIWISNKWINERIFTQFLEQIVSVKDPEIILLRGNQDTSIIKALEEYVTVYPAKGVSLFGNQLGVFHGNVNPIEEVILSSEIILGHVHPAIELIDNLKVQHKIPVYAKLNLSREEVFNIFNFYLDLEEVGLIEKVPITILPAYNHFLTGYTLNKKRRKKTTNRSYSSIRELIEHPKLEIRMTNGVDLGYLEDLFN